MGERNAYFGNQRKLSLLQLHCKMADPVKGVLKIGIRRAISAIRSIRD